MKDAKQFMATISKQERVFELLDKLDKLESMDVTDSNTNKTLSEVKAWQTTVGQFASQMEQRYPLYVDVIVPFLTGVLQVSSKYFKKWRLQ